MSFSIPGSLSSSLCAGTITLRVLLGGSPGRGNSSLRARALVIKNTRETPANTGGRGERGNPKYVRENCSADSVTSEKRAGGRFCSGVGRDSAARQAYWRPEGNAAKESKAVKQYGRRYTTRIADLCRAPIYAEQSSLTSDRSRQSRRFSHFRPPYFALGTHPSGPKLQK